MARPLLISEAMLDIQSIEDLRNRLSDWSGPVASVYARVNPAQSGESPKSMATRVKSSLEAHNVPSEWIEPMVSELERRVQPARTLVMFRSADREERVHLDVDLPVVDQQSGQVEVCYDDEPYLTPLALAFEEHERFAVVYADRDRVRMFEIFMNDAEEIDQVDRRRVEAEFDRYDDAKQVRGDLRAPRDDASKDRAEDHERVLRDRMYSEVAKKLGEVTKTRELDRVLLLGTDRNRAAFTDQMPRHLARRIVDTKTSLPESGASTNQVAETLKPIVERLEEEHEREVLAGVKERAVTGLKPVLQALQHGRLSRLVVPWGFDGTVHEGDSGWVTRDALSDTTAGGGTTQRNLRALLPSLARRYATRLEVLRGDRADTLEREHGGIAGFERW